MPASRKIKPLLHKLAPILVSCPADSNPVADCPDSQQLTTHFERFSAFIADKYPVLGPLEEYLAERCFTEERIHFLNVKYFFARSITTGPFPYLEMNVLFVLMA